MRRGLLALVLLLGVLVAAPAHAVPQQAMPDILWVFNQGLIDKLAKVFHVRELGVRYDGTDETTAFYSVFSQAGTGSIVMLDPGTVIIDPTSPNNRVLRTGMMVVGVPGRSIIQMKVGGITGGNAGQDDILLRNSNPGGGNTDITVSGIVVDQNARNSPGAFVAEGFPLRFDKVAHLRIDNVVVMDTKAGALNITECRDAKVTGTTLNRVGQGYCSITADDPCSTTPDCPGGETCVRPNGDGIQINGSIDTTIENNNFINTGEGVYCQHEASPATANVDCTENANHVSAFLVNEQCQASGIPYACCTGKSTGTAVAYGNPAVPGSSFCAAGIPLGPALGMLANGGIVSNNTVYRHWRIAVEGSNGALNTSDINVTGNELRNINAGSQNGCIALIANGANISNVTVNDNLCDTMDDACLLARVAISGETISDADFRNNTCLNSCQVFTTCGSLFLDQVGATSNFTRITFDGNRSSGGAQAALRTEGAVTSLTTKNNVLTDIGGLTPLVSPLGVWIDNDDNQGSPGVTFAELGTLATAGAVNGSRNYCKDCTVGNPCAGSGTGAMARRLNGAWVCSDVNVDTCPASVILPYGTPSTPQAATANVTVGAVLGRPSCWRMRMPCTFSAPTKLAFRIGTGGTAGSQCAEAIFTTDGLTKVLDTGVQSCAASGDKSATGLTAASAISSGTEYLHCFASSDTGTMQYLGTSNAATLFNTYQNYNVTAANIAQFNANCIGAGNPYACCSGATTGTCTGFTATLGALSAATNSPAFGVVSQ